MLYTWISYLLIDKEWKVWHTCREKHLHRKLPQEEFSSRSIQGIKSYTAVLYIKQWWQQLQKDTRCWNVKQPWLGALPINQYNANLYTLGHQSDQWYVRFWCRSIVNHSILKVMYGVAVIESLNHISGMLICCFCNIRITVTWLLLTTPFNQHNLDPVLFLLQASLLCAYVGNKLWGCQYIFCGTLMLLKVPLTLSQMQLMSHRTPTLYIYPN